jgi:hypothetical protein
MKSNLKWLTAALLPMLLLGACELMGNPGTSPEGNPEGTEQQQQAAYALNIVKEGALLAEFVFPAVYPGYADVAGLEAAISNTGTGAAEGIAISLQGAGAAAFDVSPAVIERLEAGGSVSFTVKPRTGISSGEYQAKVIVKDPQGAETGFINIKFIVSDTPLYGIRLDLDGEAYAFPTRGLNSPAAAPLTVTVTNTGNEGTGALSAALGGENAAAFTLNPAAIPSIPSGETGTFQVLPVGDLGTGTYMATVTVSGGNGLSSQFSVSIRVVDKYIEISTEKELAQIGASSAYPADAEYLLVADLVLANWIPITATPTAAFTGVFDGNKRNITVNSFDPSVLNTGAVTGYIGIFGYIQGGTVTNLTVNLGMPAQQDISAGPTGSAKIQYAGGVAGYAKNAEFEGIIITGSLNLSKADGAHLFIGGITAYLEGGSISACESRANLKGREPYYAGNGGSYTGGLAAVIDTVAISESRVSGSISAYSDRGDTFAGGAVGYVLSSSLSSLAVSAEVEASVSEDFQGMTTFGNPCYAGGIAGLIGGLDRSSEITQSYSTGTVSAVSYAPVVGGNPLYAGGIAGMTGVYGLPVLISDCYSRGTITAKTGTGFKGEETNLNAGGIVGRFSNGTVERSYAAGIITADSSPVAGNYTHAGGIVSVLYGTSTGTITIQNCAALSPQINWSLYTKDEMILNRIGIRGKGTGISAVKYDGISEEKYPESTTLSNNIANKDMVINYVPSTQQAAKVPPPIVPVSDADGEDGLDCAARPAQSVYTDLGWNFSTVWTMGGDGYPALINTP